MSTMPPRRIALLFPDSRAPDDAIRAYSLEFAQAISRTGRAEAAVMPLSGPSGAASLPQAHDAYVLEYNPYAYGRWGVAPRAVWDWQRLKHSGRTCAVTVHEAYLSGRRLSPREWVLEQLHRSQIALICSGRTQVWSTSQERTSQLRRYARGKAIAEMPIGSTVGERAEPGLVTEIRQRLHAGQPGALVVASFGKDHPVHRLDFAAAAMRAISNAYPDTVLLGLGSGGAKLPAELRAVVPGFLPQPDLAAHLAASDLLLLPYANGAAPNRSTLIAALALGCTVLTTVSQTTDPILRTSAIRMTPAADLQAYVAEALRLAGSSAFRLALRDEASALYQRAFTWNRLADRVLTALGDGERAPRGRYDRLLSNPSDAASEA